MEKREYNNPLADSVFLGECIDEDNHVNEIIAVNPLEELNKLFPNKETHMKELLRLYSFCFPTLEKPIFDKTIDEYTEDAAKAKISLDLEDSINATLAAVKRDFYFNELNLEARINQVGIFLDTAFVYFIWHYDKSAPFYKMPNSIMNLNIIKMAIELNDELCNLFSQCIGNNFIKEIRQLRPPYMLRTELTKEEIKNKLAEIEPLCHKILNKLLVL